SFVNIDIETMYSVSGPGGLPPRKVVIQDVLFAKVNMPDVIGWCTQRDISMNFIVDNGQRNLIQLDQVFVYNFNRVVGDSFQLFYNEQAADYVVPQTGSYFNLLGSPEAGLTNLQNWQKYQICIAGAIAPSSATTRDRIYGLVVPL